MKYNKIIIFLLYLKIFCHNKDVTIVTIVRTIIIIFNTEHNDKITINN